ncbi:MAG: geranylgeranylglycerol-phosphate geranylgeranyltransferase [Fibrobacteria bacterium]|nr:geranylgeranylglycerol-phosphate geranylgeranyltransferase [Fibrobacteria bacterium]
MEANFQLRRNLIPILLLGRIGNSLIAGTGVLLGTICLWYLSEFSAPFPIYDCSLGFISMLLAAFAGNIQNDLFDIETDRFAHPHRPLVTGKIGMLQAMWVYLISYLFATIFAFAISIAHGVFMLIIITCLNLYNRILKNHVPIGNIIIALLCGLAIYFPEWPSTLRHTLVPFLFAFITTYAREILKDIQDLNGDRKSGRQSLPLKYGINVAKYTAASSLLITLFALPIPVLIFHYHSIFYFLAIPLVIYPWYKCFRELHHKSPDWKIAQTYLKRLMLGGIVCIIAGVMLV